MATRPRKAWSTPFPKMPFLQAGCFVLKSLPSTFSVPFRMTRTTKNLASFQKLPFSLSSGQFGGRMTLETRLDSLAKGVLSFPSFVMPI